MRYIVSFLFPLWLCVFRSKHCKNETRASFLVISLKIWTSKENFKFIRFLKFEKSFELKKMFWTSNEISNLKPADLSRWNSFVTFFFLLGHNDTINPGCIALKIIWEYVFSENIVPYFIYIVMNNVFYWALMKYYIKFFHLIYYIYTNWYLLKAQQLVNLSIM